ncbi:MAG: hypothetical protein U9O53_05165, partial [archaeon]|nr:hypothetical protein [archaeon]
NTVIPATLTKEDIEKRKEQPYDGTRPQIMTPGEKAKYYDMLARDCDTGREAIDSLFGKITPTGNTVIPATLTKEDIKKRKEQPYDSTRPQIMTPGEKAKYYDMLARDCDTGKEAIDAIYNFIGTGKLPKEMRPYINTDAISREPIRKVVPLEDFEYLMRNIENSYDKDAITEGIRAFTEYNIKHDLILIERFQNKLDTLLGFKYAEIARYDRLATRAS